MSPAAEAPVFGRTLLVEDERNLAEALKIGLGRLATPIDHARNLAEAEDAIERARPELIVLDRMLPDGDGLTLCRSLRSGGFGGMILMLTAAGDADARIAGLEGGADDYLAKPFDWDELRARVRALSRRRLAGNEGQTSRWTLDDTRLRIQGPVGWVELTPLEYRLAGHLIRSAGAIVSRAELLKEVWGFTLLPKTRTVDHFLGRLRKMFEANPEEPRHFLTVRGAGYRFER